MSRSSVGVLRWSLDSKFETSDPPKDSLNRSAASLPRVIREHFPALNGTISRLRLLATRRPALRCLRLGLPHLHPPFASSRCGCTPVDLDSLSTRRPRRASCVEMTRPPRFLGDPCMSMRWLFDPAGLHTPGQYSAWNVAFRLDNSVGAEKRCFRGSITPPTHSLCTLRRRDRSRTTQHSVPVAGLPYRGGSCTRWIT